MNISEVTDATGQQPNFSGIQTLITPTSQYVFPPSVISNTALLSQQQPAFNTTNTTTTSLQPQEAQIQKYPPFIGTPSQSSSQSGVHTSNNRLAMISSVSTPVASTHYQITGNNDTTRKGKG